MWKILRLITALILAMQWLLIAQISNPQPVMASSSVDITITATPSGPTVGALTLTYVSESQIHIEWDTPGDAVNTMIRVQVGSYPDSKDDGYLVYYGEDLACDDAGVNFEETVENMFYRAWYEDEEEEWLPNYAEGNIGGQTVLELAESIQEVSESIGSFEELYSQLLELGTLLLALMILAIVSAFAFWKENAILIMVTGGIAFINAFFWYDMMNNYMGLAISLLLLCYALWCIGSSFRLFFWNKRGVEGE